MIEDALNIFNISIGFDWQRESDKIFSAVSDALIHGFKKLVLQKVS
jgi:hypothetical protein